MELNPQEALRDSLIQVQKEKENFVVACFRAP